MQIPFIREVDRPRAIREVLHRRTDLSTFVVHLTKDTDDGNQAATNLLSIIQQRRIFARSPMGWATTKDPQTHAPFVVGPALDSQRVVSFSETPLEHVYSLFANIAGRQVKLSPYGVAFTKMVARRIDVNPVWYVDMTRGRDWVICTALNELVRASAAAFDGSSISKITPFVEGMGTWPEMQHEFWWEREWRHVNEIDLWTKTIWLAPEEAFEWLRPHLYGRPIIDPRWSLEEIIGHLAGLEAEDMSPFVAH
jgi:hypothetical protein